MEKIIQDFIGGLLSAPFYEYAAVISGIASVWLAKRENVWVYPAGLVNTGIYVFISFKAHLPGEAAVNIYYTLMSLLGWYRWVRKGTDRRPVLQISRSTGRERMIQFSFFAVLFAVLYIMLEFFRQAFFEGAIPWADALASASAFTGMWLMTGKKLENWHWWIVTNVISAPLFFYKGFSLTSLYYFVLLIMAIGGLAAWKKKLATDAKQRN